MARDVPAVKIRPSSSPEFHMMAFIGLPAEEVLDYDWDRGATVLGKKRCKGDWQFSSRARRALNRQLEDLGLVLFKLREGTDKKYFYALGMPIECGDIYDPNVVSIRCDSISEKIAEIKTLLNAMGVRDAREKRYYIYSVITRRGASKRDQTPMSFAWL